MGQFQYHENISVSISFDSSHRPFFNYYFCFDGQWTTLSFKMLLFRYPNINLGFMDLGFVNLGAKH